MSYKILISDTFKKQSKRLQKKHSSFKNDLTDLVTQLKSNPKMGESLGKSCFKIRLQIRSKNKGKSGGARVITFIIHDKETLILTAVYDKSDLSNISESMLNKLILKMNEEYNN